MCPCLAYAQPEMPGLFYSVVWTAQTLDFCPFLPLTWSEAGRKVAQGAAIDCFQSDQSLGTRSVKQRGALRSLCGVVHGDSRSACRRRMEPAHVGQHCIAGTHVRVRDAATETAMSSSRVPS